MDSVTASSNLFRAAFVSLWLLLVSVPDRAAAQGLPEVTAEEWGLNAFVNDSRFGSISTQFREVRSTLYVKHVRVLFAWNDDVQPSPHNPPDFSFYDAIARRIPAGVDALVILTGTPSWMSDSRNWIDGNPRLTFVERWVRPLVRRYASNPRIVGWQIFNEPNSPMFAANDYLQITGSAENYVELLAAAHAVAKDEAPGKLVVAAATSSINQNFPDTLLYNYEMLSAGAEQFLDIWAIHYYGTAYEKILFPGGVRDFLSQLNKPIWMTESGAKGTTKQKNYVTRTWPVLKYLLPQVKRFYYYQFTEAASARQTYGLKSVYRSRVTTSDLYSYLKRGLHLR